MKHLFKSLLYFSPVEKRGILLLLALIVIAGLCTNWVHTWQRNKYSTLADTVWQASVHKQYAQLMATIDQKKTDNRRNYTNHNKPFQANTTTLLTPFNPNTADSITFRQLGLPAWMAHNILSYRAKGGKFRKAEDFKKIYGLTEVQYTSLSPYIYIYHQDTARSTTTIYTPRPPQQITVKHEAGTIVDLNRADTTQLKMIPGIGSGIAGMIDGFRQRLGGFYSVEQLGEIDLDVAQLHPWFSIDTTCIRRINLNRASVSQLRSHPYINFYQAKAIVEYRKKEGTIRSLKPFALCEEFSGEDLERIDHYVCFDE